MRRREFPWSLWLRALLYMGLVGGGWLVVLPFLLLLWEHNHRAIALRSAPFVFSGASLFLLGAALALLAGWHLVMRGQGTPFPLDPTRSLVTSGPYAFVRNPQAIAMVLMVVGEIAAVRSWLLWLLLPLTLVYLEVLVGPWEERELFRQHGERYARYQRRVRKWLPQRRPDAVEPE